MKYSLKWLQTQLQQGLAADYLLFWGHTPKQAGKADKSCFSQWFHSVFTVDGISYKTAEHWMMAKKALLFNDKEAVEKILAAEKPAIAKALGRGVKNFNAAVWESAACSLVVEGNRHKFSQNITLKNFLLETDRKILVEASPSDTIWGIGLTQDAAEAVNPFKWRGTNLLGFALMEVRDTLTEDEAALKTNQ